jgi:hypothetical protein
MRHLLLQIKHTAQPSGGRTMDKIKNHKTETPLLFSSNASDAGSLNIAVSKGDSRSTFLGPRVPQKN